MKHADNFQQGFSLVEVIITMVILAIGMLGLAGMQARAINAEAESFSVGMGMMMAAEMTDRMNANLSGVAASSAASTGYNQSNASGTTAPTSKTEFGTNYNNDCITATNNTQALQAACCAAKSAAGTPVAIAARDLCEWDLALKGIGEASGTTKVGGMTGTRGCVYYTGTTNKFRVEVVWQGRDIGAVGSDNSCGATAIPSRRSGVSQDFQVADLDGS